MDMEKELDMEALAKELRAGIDITCATYHYYKDEKVLIKAIGLAERIQQFCGTFLQGNIYGMEEEEYLELQDYVIQVLKDYLEAVEQKDLLYILDTLDHGLRELVEIYIDDEEDEETEEHE